eukprot:tig00020908_g15314.t1
MFTMPAGHGLGSGRGLFQAIAGAASVVRRSCFKFVAPANANACILTVAAGLTSTAFSLAKRSLPRLSPGPARPRRALPRPAPGPGRPPLARPSPGPAPGPGPPSPSTRTPEHTKPGRGLKPAGRPQIYKYSGELDAATELLDRALYCLEAAWHPQFKPASGACRLDFAVMENKCAENPLYPEDNLYPPPDSPRHPQGLVFRRLQMLIRGGCSAPPRDLMGVLQCIDYFALRAREYKFLLELVAAPALPGAPPPYALMRVARDGGAAPSTSWCPAPLRISSKTEARQVLRRLFSHTLDPASPAPPTPSAAPSPPPSCGRRGWAALHRRPLFDDDEPAASVELPPLTAGSDPGRAQCFEAIAILELGTRALNYGVARRAQRKQL